MVFMKLLIHPFFVGNGSSNSICVDNPLDSNKKYLRSNLTQSLLENLFSMKEDKKIQLNYLKYRISIHEKITKLNVKESLQIIASGRAGHNYRDFSKKLIRNSNQFFKRNLYQVKILNIKVLSRDEIKY